MGTLASYRRRMGQPLNAVTDRIIHCAIDVHRTLGPGLLESPYEHCLAMALDKAGLRVEQQKPVPLTYEGSTISCAYRVDLAVNEEVLVEVKSVHQLTNLHRAQMLSYLRLTGRKLGLVLNFNVKLLRDGGIMRVVDGLEDEKL